MRHEGGSEAPGEGSCSRQYEEGGFEGWMRKAGGCRQLWAGGVSFRDWLSLRGNGCAFEVVSASRWRR